MPRFFAVFAVALTLLLAAPHAAGQLFIVPSIAYPTIQDALDAAPPGAEIDVLGGTYGPIDITKPVTIAGSAAIVADSVPNPFGGGLLPPIRCTGTSGRVVLDGLSISGTTNGAVFGTNVSGIVCDGFDELIVRNCDVESPRWENLTGLGIGKPGIAASVSIVRIENSTVIGGFTDIDGCDATSLEDGAAGIDASGTVTVGDGSDVQGGAGPIICISFGCDVLPPDPCATFTGSGGPGIICDTAIVDFTTSTVTGGAGADVSCFESKTTFLCSMPDGEDIVARTTLSLGGQLVVPGTHDTIPEALDASGPGDIILVLGGTHAPFTVDERVTLLAEPRATVQSFSEGPAVTFDGRGFGRATLRGFDLFVDDSETPATVTVSGFDDVALLDCNVFGNTPKFVPLPTDGVPGIASNIGHLLLSNTTVTGGHGAVDSPIYPEGPVPRGGAAVVILGGGALTALDSTLTGGDGVDTPSLFPCVACELFTAGEGGPALRSDGATYTSNSALIGGDGAVIACFPTTTTGKGAESCFFPDGPTVLGKSVPVDLGFDLVGSGPLEVGAMWTLGWQATAPSVLLVISTVASSPVEVPDGGVLYASLETATITPLPGAGTFFVSGPIPNDPALLGVLVTFQIFDPLEGFSRPLIEPFSP